MRILCVDDERKTLEHTVAMCRRLPAISEAEGFVHAADALASLDETAADLALLDIVLPEMNGLELAARMKQKQPDLAIVFLTGYAEYAVDAFALHASGYLLKPVTEERLADEIAYALADKLPRPCAHVEVQTFGGFDLFVDGETVAFKYARSKELLAYLVDRCGSSVTRAEAFAVLWEDRKYDRPMQKQLDVIIRSLRATLEKYGIGEIFELKRGNMRVCPEHFSCDAYRFFGGDISAVNAFRGEYMNAYSWASMTESYMTWKMGIHP